MEDGVTPTITLTDIPWDDVIFEKIFLFLNLKDIFHLRSVSKKYKELAEAYLLNCREINIQSYKYFNKEAFQVLCNHCKGVRHLNVSKSRWLDNELFEKFLANNTDIIEVNISYCPRITSKGLQPLILKCKNLKIFKASSCSWFTTGALDALIYHQENLETVDFTRCIGLEELSILKFLVKFRKLKNLSIAHIPSVTDRTLMMILRHCEMLEFLNVDGCAVTFQAIRILQTNCKTLQIVKRRIQYPTT